MFKKVQFSWIKHVLLCLIIMVTGFISVSISSLETNATLVACLGDTVSFDCCVNGSLSTVWQGTAFTNGKRCLEEITLLHGRFNLSDYQRSSNCPNSLFVAQSLSGENDYYCSQLNMTVNSIPVLNRVLTIQCSQDDGNFTHPVVTYSIKTLDNDATMCRGPTSQKEIMNMSQPMTIFNLEGNCRNNAH